MGLKADTAHSGAWMTIFEFVEAITVDPGLALTANDTRGPAGMCGRIALV
jgi:hypothetical protein